MPVYSATINGNHKIIVFVSSVGYVQILLWLHHIKNKNIKQWSVINLVTYPLLLLRLLIRTTVVLPHVFFTFILLLFITILVFLYTNQFIQFFTGPHLLLVEKQGEIKLGNLNEIPMKIGKPIVKNEYRKWDVTNYGNLY